MLKHGCREDVKQTKKQSNLVHTCRKKLLNLISKEKDSKTVWKAIRRLTNKIANCATTITDDVSADNLNYHFTSVVKQVIKAIIL